MIKHCKIPLDIIHICFTFFYENNDYFVDSGEGLFINDDMDVVKCSCEGMDSLSGFTCFGGLELSNNKISSAFIYHWRFKIQYENPAYWSMIAIGIVRNYSAKSKFENNNELFNKWHYAFYDKILY